jgi:FixJ family two-component response regulator
MLVVDIVLPFVNGSELARVLSNQRPATKCLMMSGYNEVPSDVEKLQKLSKCRFIQKPFRLYELHTVVEEMLADGEGEATADTPQPSTAYPNPTPKRGG